MSSRFATVSEEVGRKIIEEKDAKKTQKMTLISLKRSESDIFDSTAYFHIISPSFVIDNYSTMIVQ